jgi:hypothetical protein
MSNLAKTVIDMGRGGPALYLAELAKRFAGELMLTPDRKPLTATEPPAGLTHALAGLWPAAQCDWTRAHESAQQDKGKGGSRVHAYLHRKGGDPGNAAYLAVSLGGQVSRPQAYRPASMQMPRKNEPTRAQFQGQNELY